ncbi:hypothetical protein RJ639_002132 [Escallonia herrerae]|uniref:Uncharacterized protein n=1 Tax=Escallonia herrerae TaxID=1293975 RepID=A0AA88XIW5_9ASTE|nr:hypothetical protein RJ639_002132 [Escallonia herrerae]
MNDLTIGIAKIIIITWFCNTSVPSVYQQFGHYNTATKIWSLLTQRYTTADLAHQYQLHDSLHRMKQEPDQSINSSLSQMQGIWDQLELSEPSWTCSEDSTQLITCRPDIVLVTPSQPSHISSPLSLRHSSASFFQQECQYCHEFAMASSRNTRRTQNRNVANPNVTGNENPQDLLTLLANQQAQLTQLLSN